MTVHVLGADAPGALERAVSILRAGGLVAIPTETVYGLAARASDDDAVAKVFLAKGRPRTHPLIVHVHGASAARAWAAEWSPRAEALARAFWPGPLTLVVPKRDSVGSAITGGGDSVALRAPRHPVAQALLELLGEGLVAPSANRYQSISPTRAEHVASSLESSPVDVLVLDAGPTTEGLESTVLDVRGERARILRPGTLGRAAIESALGESVEAFAGAIAESEARASPGMDRRHYAPKARLVVAPSREAARALAATLGGRAARVSFGEDSGAISLPEDAAGAGRELYDLLHRLDSNGVTDVVVEAPPTGADWEAVRDRLGRAGG